MTVKAEYLDAKEAKAKSFDRELAIIFGGIGEAIQNGDYECTMSINRFSDKSIEYLKEKHYKIRPALYNKNIYVISWEEVEAGEDISEAES